MCEPTVAKENKHKRYASEEPVEPILQCFPGHQDEQRDEQQTARGVKHGEQEEHRVGDPVAGSVQHTDIQSSLADDGVHDEWRTDQDGVQEEGGLVDAFSASPNIGSKRQGKRCGDEDKQRDGRCSCC